MPTDTERREVARKLRLYGNRKHANFCMAYVVAAMGIDLIETIEHRDDAKLYRTLADLIEPAQDHFVESDEKVDRAALLALADEMDAYTKCDDERCGREMPPRVIHDFARRIREALGVQDGD